MSYYTKHPDIQSGLDDIRKLKDHIQIKCQELSNKEIDQELQEEISTLVILLPRIEKILLKTVPGNTWWEKMPNLFTPDRREHLRGELKILVDFLHIAVDSLFQEMPNLYLARSIRIDIERVIYKYEHPLILGFLINRFMDAQRSPSMPLKVISGLIAALLINGIITFPIVSLYIYLEATSQAEQKLQEITNKANETTALIDRTTSLINNILGVSTSGSGQRPQNTQVPASGGLAASRVVGQALDPQLIRQNRELKNLQDLLTSLQKQQDALQKQQEVLQMQQQLEQGNIRIVLQIVLVISAGTLGSIVSILIRIEEFQDKTYIDPLVPFLIGAFKPIIGAAFGLLFFALISSEIIIIKPIANQTDNSKGFFVFAVAFVVGFSERLARDTLVRAEGLFGGGQTADLSAQPTVFLNNHSVELRQNRALRETTFIESAEHHSDKPSEKGQ